jgi:carbamoyltransferase
LLGISSPDDVGLLNRAAALERIRADASPAASLVRWLYLEEPQTGRELARCFGAAGREQLSESKLSSPRGTLRTARLRLDVVGGSYVLADRRLSISDSGAFGLPKGDMVYPPGGDSVLLANALPKEDGDVLDLCTGSGVQALLAARSARRVVGVDIGARAVAVARCNSKLNGAENVAFRSGNLFAPVRGQRFDLIVANPPFVAGPWRGPAYHSGGPFGDRVLKRIVAGLPNHLKSGGRALLVSHLALRRGERVADRLRPWFDAGRGRALALELEEGSAVDLAAAQSVFALRDGLGAYGQEIRRWIAYLDRRRIERIVLVLLAYEKRGRAGLEVVEAFQRSLPLPLSRSPRDLVHSWFDRQPTHSSSDSTT